MKYNIEYNNFPHKMRESYALWRVQFGLHLPRSMFRGEKSLQEAGNGGQEETGH